ncbi:uncharacterized protein B0J16DRAFT_341366 [Fusarium flagelliforme]|uniref:uncharacterized protein n=1 Tax=Fusarium flagelliforme TaxID=2675880 RepID=UPI001E8DBA39|nr:uncharacterized protein B0J16DRAFT_341366 [Fusarium flagelliforme]KAH7185330.1 hypothetical protein B0J16DRAFT_341366 [Fusarium flagelliforme]
MRVGLLTFIVHKALVLCLTLSLILVHYCCLNTTPVRYPFNTSHTNIHTHSKSVEGEYSEPLLMNVFLNAL